MGNILTEKIAFKALQTFFKDKPMVIFGTGMSCAVDCRYGMESLKGKLIENIKEEELSPEQQIEWQSVVEALNKDKDLESAMNKVENEGLIHILIKIAGDFIASLDRDYSWKILNKKTKWPPINLFKRLVDRLPPSQPVLHVATPNYDMLAEYSFGKESIHFINGFYGGVYRSLDWNQSNRAVIVYGTRLKRLAKKTLPHIRLYKPHGSINAFVVDNRMCEIDSYMYNPPEGVERLIVTPGNSKYHKLHDFRKELLGVFDTAIAGHSSFLFLGFGFNDDHLINHAVEEKLKNQKCNGLIITKHSNERIESLLNEADNLWLVCRQDDNDNTRIRNKKYTGWLNLNNYQIWNVEEFERIILGG